MKCVSKIVVFHCDTAIDRKIKHLRHTLIATLHPGWNPPSACHRTRAGGEVLRILYATHFKLYIVITTTIKRMQDKEQTKSLTRKLSVRSITHYIRNWQWTKTVEVLF